MEYSILGAILLAVCLGSVEGDLPAYASACGSSTTTALKSLTITNCSNTDRICKVKRGESYTVTIQFQPESNYEAAKTYVAGIYAKLEAGSANLPIQPILTIPGTCRVLFGTSKAACSLSSSRTYTFTRKIFIRPTWPMVGGTLAAYLNVTGETSSVFCTKIAARIISSS